MITLEKGDLFEGAYDAISHGCNTQGLMGAGIAKVFRDKFPNMHEAYRFDCQITAKPGGFMRYHENGKTIYNLYSQEQPGADATKVRVFLSLLGASHDVMINAPLEGDKKFRFAMPLIGCGIGGLEFTDLMWGVETLDLIFGSKIEYVIVYNDSNEHLVKDYIHVGHAN